MECVASGIDRDAAKGQSEKEENITGLANEGLTKHN